ncbi:lipopolysaccharide 3-alpha-galactosyltransferase [Brenneria goodwinii]|uniref:lipopolysaccharide 3-alpha-galactosyltransferase n=1 Tax=Brenneria goodwinii TaxID=1109412 RepID=UPI000EF2110C|nr:lipopolysaccharide 3-alpha-galactosyltransferase [Brenneria goodwinii]MCG8158487.1 lipopolysaccharide 3-alpha-galactosyltransferase [Brenneria goodwinii]MCG8163107.1 lipopolysaccharide 3-alpha-galactosyltransferase [Brenneria goodwinii]MCG8167607.1 lipopolysaccharide 3-alpha-galactosyltransferase [Brenneria goodwinii]MCG8172198.1 lipopolysaccharide 3-alpha-galactosyltransferase [Brenneria goodwinii]MCG8176462.1 lipopolysaccharide 3-alpha-galactosyltransferase [Brenneria goodwinii]
MYFKKDDVITETISFSFSPSHPDNDALNIAFGTDKNFLFGCAVSIASILLKNSDRSMVFHVFTDTLDQENRDRFNALAKQYNTSITLYVVNCDWLKRLPSTKNWSYAIYFRFIAIDYFYNQLNKIVYLDSDIVCNGSLQQLATLDIDNYIVAAVTEGESAWWEKSARRLETPAIKDGYFNSGFLLINVDNWHRNDITKKTMLMLTDKDIAGKISYPDQDILNILLPGHILFLDKKYNTQFSINYELKCKSGETYPHPINNSTIFIHYIGPTKPWHEWAEYPSSRYFYIAKDNSPWKCVPLEKAISTNQLRYCAKHYFHKKRIISSFISYLKYFIKKLFTR